MGEPTGFMNYAREGPAERPPEERIRDWKPLHLALPEARLNSQAARCMDCGIPFCHTGRVLNGMASGCPINNLIPEWNDLVYRGLWREAYERLEKTNNFPEFTGLVCPAPCEAACTLGIQDPPVTASSMTVSPVTASPVVTIKNIELAIIEKAFEEGWVGPQMPARRTGKRVAVVGSGPAGLACAEQLNKVGHRVTVFERADRVGGLLTYGIPNMKLEKGLVERRTAIMAAAGIEFVTGVEIGVDYPAERLRDDFEAIVLCTGAARPRDLPVEGRALGGIHFAMDYLAANTKSLLDGGRRNGQYISAEGKDVVVIGGGDTGTDCVGTAMRHGCNSLVQFEILPRPPDERAVDNPWPQWPRIYRQDYGQEEAAAVFGRDPRHFSLMTKQFLSDGEGNLRAVQTVDVTWESPKNGNGRPELREVPGSERTWPAQIVLLAMGFLGPEQLLLKQLGVERDERSNVKATYGDYATSSPGIFAAGDARRGQSLVVWAINEGRGAARACDLYLMGATDLP
jgi:glutamate synthase (NADPH/NADH) small chain